MIDLTMRSRPRPPVAPLVLAALLLAPACAAPWGGAAAGDGPPAERLARAEAQLASGSFSEGVGALVGLRREEDLPPDVRERAERSLVRAGLERIEAVRGDARELKALFGADLPRRVRARAGLLAAEALFEDDRPVAALEWIQRVDRKLPHHPERALAGEVLSRVGLHLIQRPGRYSLLFRYRTKGIKALEYLVLRYPLAPRCDEAYFLLSQTYETVGELDWALERIEDLLVYHPESPLAVAAKARLPYLRLRRLARDDYERRELVTAAAELDDWLARHAGHELAGWVRELRETCARRLAENDLALARYYDRIDSPAGRDLHARRALTTARAAELVAYEQEARALLGPESAVPGKRRARPASDTAERDDDAR